MREHGKMRWSFKVARIGGIEVRIHVTFFILLAVLASYYGAQGGDPGRFESHDLFPSGIPLRALARVRPCFRREGVWNKDGRHHSVADWRCRANGTDAGKTGPGVGRGDRRPTGERGHRGRVDSLVMAADREF